MCLLCCDSSRQDLGPTLKSINCHLDCLRFSTGQRCKRNKKTGHPCNLGFIREIIYVVRTTRS